jgi:ADP-dependent NAD(P)H-hydrate dehydratase / NAD(P)H-hydrate epimerase
MLILTAAQMREADRLTTERYAIPSLQLMENAGAAVSAYLLAEFPNIASLCIVVLCGKGNNGGDGLVVARRLREIGASPRVILFAEPSALLGDAAVNFKAWQSANGEMHLVTNEAQWAPIRKVVTEADLIVDALLGTGLTGPVKGLLATVIGDVNAAAGLFSRGTGPRRHVVSVDMPSGLSSDTTEGSAEGASDVSWPVVAADATVTFTAPKLGQMVSPLADHVGKLVVRQIGTPPALLDELLENELRQAGSPLSAYWLEPGEFRAIPMVRRRDANKGSFGHALVVAGSLGKSGAALLAGSAALRVGAGLVTVATPAPVLPIVAGGMPELMSAPLEATAAGTASLRNLDYGRFPELASGKSVLAIGPGLSTNAETQELIRAVVSASEIPVILDADGLNAFAGRADELAARKTPLLAITPHPGEMARLLATSVKDVQAHRLSVALDAAKRWRAYVVLKGFHTILATPDGRAFFNTTGNPGMATGGTGDVLTGILAGVTAEFGTDNWERVLGFGIYLHGLAGDLAAGRFGEAPLVAGDLIDALPQTFAELLDEWKFAQC